MNWEINIDNNILKYIEKIKNINNIIDITKK